MIVTENSQTRRIAVEAATVEGSKSYPARGQHAAEMAARKREDIAGQRPHFGNEPIGASGDLFDRFAAGTAIAEKLPIGPEPFDFGGRLSFIQSIIPFDEIAVLLGDRTEPGQGGTFVRWRCSGLVKTATKAFPARAGRAQGHDARQLASAECLFGRCAGR